ncbi:MAG: GyrI-like domain-containing protein [Paracoccaceae bacterium]
MRAAGAPGSPFGRGDLARRPPAVLAFKGPYAGLPAAYDQLFGIWLPQSGEEPADSPVFELYLNTPMDTAPEQLLTEICMPLKPRSDTA